ncbi:arabinose efflux permease family protein [Clostridium sp. CAG:1013]|nr:arabinose efflux permease family protein [Clostridium sp. CAG:1013]
MSEKKEKLWTPKYAVVLLNMLCNGMAGMMTLPIVAKYALSVGADLTSASAIAGMMSLVALVVCPFAGVLCDKGNRKYILIAANLGYGLSLALHCVCVTIPALIAVRMATGLFFSVCTVANVAYSSAYIPKTRTGEGLGYVGLSTIIAQALGPMVGMKLQETGGYSLTFLVAGGFAFLCIFFLVILPYPATHSVGSGQKGLHLRDLFAAKFTLFMLMAFLFSSAGGLISTYLAIIADARQIADVTMYFTVFSILSVALRPITGRILDTKGIFCLIIPAFLGCGLCMIFVGVGQALIMFLIASVFGAIGQGSGLPSIQAHCVKMVDKTSAGVATSTIMIGQNVGNAVAPVIGSFFIGAFDYQATFAGAGVFIIIAGVIFTLAQWKNTKRHSVSMSEKQ